MSPDTYEDVPRQVQRRIESQANVRNLDVKDAELERSVDEGDTYRVVVDDPDAEEGENPAFFVTRPKTQGTFGDDMFSDRLSDYFDAVRKKVMDVEDDNADLDETLAELDEDHPAASGEDVDYGPGPQANTDGLNAGYDDGQIRVASTTEADMPSAAPTGSTSETTSDASSQTTQTHEQTTEDTTDERTTTQDNDARMPDNARTITDDFFGDIADAALDAQQLEQKGHDRAAEALLDEIREDIEDYLDGDD